jgi:ferric-dicitrate binding protein FerR (iron transport regulator)
MNDLIAKYLFDELTLNEDSRLKYWIKQSPENQIIFNHSLETLKLLESSGNSAFAGAEPSWQILKNKIEEINRNEEPLVNRGLYFIMNSHITQSKLARVAAIILLLIGFVFSFQYIVLYDGGAQTQPFQLASAEDFGRLELNTGDEIDVVFLPDKSLVYLNKNSTLIYDERFNGDERIVYLKGESFFKIAHNPDKPFIVYTDYTKTKVLGTSFNINAGTDLTEVSVFSGTVGFSKIGGSEKNMEILEKNERLIFRNSSGLIKRMGMHGYASIGWINNDIEFDESAFVSTQGDNNVDNAMEIKSKDANAAEGVKVIAPEKVIANKEEKNPVEFLNNISKWSNILFWEGKLMKITKIDGKVFNSSNYTTYNNLTLRASMYDADNNILGQEEFRVNADIRPGEVLDYKQQLGFWDNNTDKVIVEIKHAHPK